MTSLLSVVAIGWFIYWIVRQFQRRTEVFGASKAYSSPTTADAKEDEPISPMPGVYTVNHDLRRGSQRSALMITATPETLPEVFLDLVEKLGEKIVLVLDEKLPFEKPLQMLSFTPPLEARQLQTSLAEFADVLNCRQAIEVTAQNADKCCYMTLRPDKSIVVEACNATPFISALERRGLRRVQSNQLNHQLPSQNAADGHELFEDRLAQLKQRLEISSCYVAGLSWVN
ncbi:hypothetical protein L0337_07915 [candidate division KSB1 bacterium]|nr:hypothetical protein [candidate division KSB1 bacterium]